MLLVKIGGGKNINIEGVAADLAALGRPAVLVHGANAWRDELAEKLGVEKEVLTSLSGYDSVFSSPEALDVMLMAYAGLRNKRLVECLQRRGLPAAGLTGLDGRLIQGRRNPGIRVRQGGKTLLRRDFSGKPKSVNTGLLRLLLENGYLPVLTAPIVDEDGYAINTENDDVVALLQQTLRAADVISLLEAPGFLADPADPASVIGRLTPGQLRDWETRATGRIKRKLKALVQLLEHHPARVILADGRVDHPLLAALAGQGTVIQ